MAAKQPIQLEAKQDLENYVQQTGQLGQLAQVFSVLDQERAVRGIARVREAEEAATIRHLTGETPVPKEDDMQLVNFGTITHEAPRPDAKPALSRIAKAGIAAALVASGVGAGAAIPLAISALTKDAPAVVSPPTNTTTERDYSIGDVLIESGATE